MQRVDGDARADVRGRVGRERSLVADVVDREDAARGAEDALVPGVGGAQQQRRERGVPVVAVHDVRREAQSLAAFERGAREHQVTRVLVRRVGIDARPIEDRRAIDQVEPEIGARQAGGPHAIVEFARADLDREPLELVGRALLDALQFHEPVQRDEHAHVVAAPGQVASQRRGDVAEPAGLRERGDLGGKEADALAHDGRSLPHTDSTIRVAARRAR